jgi:hypothetical protein
MRKSWLCLFAAAASCIAPGVQAQESSAGGPGCGDRSPKQCLELALDAIGGRDRLQQVKSVRLAQRRAHAACRTIVPSGAVHHFV